MSGKSKSKPEINKKNENDDEEWILMMNLISMNVWRKKYGDNQQTKMFLTQNYKSLEKGELKDIL